MEDLDVRHAAAIKKLCVDDTSMYSASNDNVSVVGEFMAGIFIFQKQKYPGSETLPKGNSRCQW